MKTKKNQQNGCTILYTIMSFAIYNPCICCAENK